MAIIGTINYLERKRLLAAGLINALLFTIVLVAGCPVYHSGEELNMLQTLAGGYGVPASACLPFMYNMHFFLNLPLKYLFGQFPDINWFSLSMILAQFVSCVSLYYLLLCRQRFAIATLTFFSFFVVFEIWMVLNLDTSSTSMICTLAGTAMIWHYFQQPVAKRGLAIGGILTITLGACFRMHTLVPVILVALPFFLLIPSVKKILFALGTLAITFLLITILFKLQDQYYSAHVPGWRQQEQHRQAIYSYVNYFHDTTQPAPGQLPAEMTENLLFFDTTMPDTKTLLSIAHQTRAGMPVNNFFSVNTWYWHFINNRLYLFALIVPFMALSFRKKGILVVAAAFTTGIAAIGYLLMFRKIPDYLIPGITAAIFYCTLLTGTYQATTGRLKQIAVITATIFLLGWSVLRMYKINRHNADSFQQFREMYSELKRHPDKLFISTGDGTPFFYFYCFATASSYPFRNILFIGQPVISRAPYLLSEFGIKDIRQAPLYDNVYFRGPEKPVLLRYYQQVWGQNFSYSDSIPGFKSSAIRKIIARP